MEPHTASSPDAVGSKRKRVSRACRVCRQRKSRCNGVRPRCQLCSNNGLDCHYDAPASASDSASIHHVSATSSHVPARAGSSERDRDRRTIASLEERLQSMEGVVRGLVAIQATHVPQASTVIAHDMNLTPSTPVATSPALHGGGVDGMASIDFSEETSSGAFGPTSNSVFLDKILNSHHIAFALGSDVSPAAQGFGDLNSHFLSRPLSPPPAVWQHPTTSHSAHNINPFMLPPRAEIQRLVDHFFENTGKLFPYLYKPAILSAIASVTRNGFRNVERAQLCLLHLTMAFATTHGPSNMTIETRMAQGDIYFQRALGLIPDLALAIDNLESIQALVMATQYVQGSQRSAQTWELLGRLVHASLQVGLYRVFPTTTTEDRLKQELRKRIWWMCFIMDKMCSMTFGRPPLLPNAYMQIELPTEAELEELAGDSLVLSQPSLVPTSSLLRATANLYLILGEIINDVYGSNIPISQTNLPLSQLLAKVLNTEHDLAGWVQGLPPSLVPIEIKRFEDGLDNAQIHPFQVILTLRYLNVRTLLHRAVLSHLLGATRSESDTNKKDSAFAFASSSLENCLATAMDTIAMISRSRGRQDVSPVWWYSIYFSFSSALVIYGCIVAFQRYAIRPSAYSLEELAASLQLVPDLIGQIGGGTNQVIRCQKIIRLLLQPASALIASMQSGPSVGYLLADSGASGSREHLQATIPNPFLGSLNGFGGDNMFTDLSAFSDELSTLFPGGL